MSKSGRYVASRVEGGIEVIDAIGASPRQHLAVPGVVDFACVGEALWVIAAGTGVVDRYAFDLRRVRPSIPVGTEADEIVPSTGDRASSALVRGERPVLALGIGDKVSATPIEAPGTLFPLVGRNVLAVADDLRLIEAGEAGRRELVRMPLGERVVALAASVLFGGRAIALLIRGARGTQFLVLHPKGGVVHRISVPDPQCWAIAENRGLAVLVVGDELHTVDLRYGYVTGHYVAPGAIAELALDSDAQFVLVVGSPGAGAPPVLTHSPYTDFLAQTRRADADRDGAPDDGAPDDGAPDGAANEEPDAPAVEPPRPPEVRTDAADAPRLVEEIAARKPPVIVPDLVPRAFGDDPAPVEVAGRSNVPPYDSAREHMDELIDVVAARVARAIAEAWNTGRLSSPVDDRRPFEREVLAILGKSGQYAPDLLEEAEERLARDSQRAAARAAATVAGGRSLPFVDLTRELGLSPTAAKVLLVVIAPHVRGEIARLYGVLANDEHRPLVDRYLIELLLASSDPRMRAEIAGELAPDAPLIRFGLVRHDGDSPLFGALNADPVLVDRLRGRESGSATGVTQMRSATRTFDELHLPAEIKRDLVLALAEPRPPDAPLRLVIRGRRGAGRHSAIAALAVRVGRRIAAIDVHRLPRSAVRLALALRIELARALVRRAVPVVSGLETVDASDPEGQEAIHRVLRMHPGPIVIRATPEGSLPIEPGYVSIKLPPVSESDRVLFWTEALARARLAVDDVADLAQRFRIGPGVIERVIETVCARRGQLQAQVDAEAGPAIIEVATQHIATRLGHVAAHVTRLARWEQVALPEDILDSLKEFIARVRHRRTVYERWGFDVKMTTSRGLSALFYGPPGTGKSMVAGLIARELGLELYRVDLARVVSKWIGETEKNLAEIFDAAEDGQVVILFDEADSLFSRRTEVKSSVDRYANLEVNYLLQRLDSFEGVCILTTNLEGSIDPAFKRRMSLRLHFPFPDEEMRVRLWAAHVPPEAPTLGDFDFAELAHRFPLSGGYIRNSAVRAAFLAAQEQRPLSQSYLVRAIQLEYRELGKLSTTGRME